MLGIDSDNEITFSRGRSYKKNGIGSVNQPSYFL